MTLSESRESELAQDVAARTRVLVEKVRRLFLSFDHLVTVVLAWERFVRAWALILSVVVVAVPAFTAVADMQSSVSCHRRLCRPTRTCSRS